MNFTFDSGWQHVDCVHVRGWCKQQRMVRVHPKTSLAEVNTWIDQEQAAWAGQAFGHSVRFDGAITITRSVDSGD